MAKQKKETTKNNACKDRDELVKSINKDFGAGAVMVGGDDAILPVDAISTGAATLDYALGVFGVPKGRIVELYGPESSGKTTLTLSIIRECQKLGGTTAFIDAEHALDPLWAENIGVNMDELLISQPDSGEQAIEIAERMCYSNQVQLIIVDSVAALIPKAEIEGEMGDANIGAQARLMSKAMRKLNGAAKGTNTSIIFINQIREKIGVMFGNPETTPGGRALKFYASVRMEIRRLKAIKDGDNQIGNEVRVKVIKNKVAPPFKVAEFSIYFGDGGVYGVDKASSVLNLGVDLDIIGQTGSWYNYGELRLGNGRDAAAELLRTEENGLIDEISGKIKEKIDAARKPKKEKAEKIDEADSGLEEFEDAE